MRAHSPLRLASFIALLALASQAMADPVTINTRFGPLKNNSEDTIEFKGKVVVPEITVPSTAYVVGTYKLASGDVVLVQQPAGNACPGQYNFISVDATGAKASPTFGTCYDDEIKPTQVGDTIAFSMKKRGGKGSVRYIFERGVVFENGQPVKP